MDTNQDQLVADSIRTYYLLQPAAFAAEEDAMREHFEKSNKAYAEVEASKTAAEKLVSEIEKTPDYKAKICAALEKGVGIIDPLVKAVVAIFGINLLSNNALTIGVPPQAVVVAVTVALVEMGTGYFCADA